MNTPHTEEFLNLQEIVAAAELAVQHGVEVVYVSNHGGRQLDHGLGSAAVLPQVVAAVAGRAEVWVDGGFMRGTDVVKAVALSAKAVGLGRLPCLGLLGVTSFAELTPQHLAAAPPVGEPGVFSAFPLLGKPSGD